MVTKFEKDLSSLMKKLCLNIDKEVESKLMKLKNNLITLRSKNMVKINHSIMELVCAKYLLTDGYDVDVERFLDSISCDLYAQKGFGHMIVEVETGYVPPEHALDPLTYCRARIASKITRYSEYAEKFVLATPPHYIMQIPSALIKPPRSRLQEEIFEIKGLCDLYYKHPPVTIEEIKNARLQTNFIINVDTAKIIEVNPSDYNEKSKKWTY